LNAAHRSSAVGNPIDERRKFIARLLDGEKMAGRCRGLGISRKTGYEILTRYEKLGLEVSPTSRRRSLGPGSMKRVESRAMSRSSG
jgi:hypothetical protein